MRWHTSWPGLRALAVLVADVLGIAHLAGGDRSRRGRAVELGEPRCAGAPSSFAFAGFSSARSGDGSAAAAGSKMAPRIGRCSCATSACSAAALILASDTATVPVGGSITTADRGRTFLPPAASRSSSVRRDVAPRPRRGAVLGRKRRAEPAACRGRPLGPRTWPTRAPAALPAWPR